MVRTRISTSITIGPSLTGLRGTQLTGSIIYTLSGGLGVLDLQVQNKALLLKNLHKFYNRHDIPWVNLIWNSYYTSGNLPGRRLEGSFWCKAHLKLIDTFKGMAQCNMGDGKSTLFWTDLRDNECLNLKFPHLITFAKGTNDSVHDIIHQEYLQDVFNLPLSQQAFDEFL
jgi:hypothetical protein